MGAHTGTKKARLFAIVVIAALMSLLGASLDAMAATGPPPPSKFEPPLKWGQNPNTLNGGGGSTTQGQFVPLSPTRILDTRTQNAPLGKQGSRTVQVGGQGGVPTNATAVVMNVTVTQATASSFLTVSPAGQPRPNASNLNYVAGQTVPNLVKVRLGSGGAVNMYNHDGSAHVLMDVAGYYTGNTAPPTASKYKPLSPARILDTRTQNAPLGNQGSRTVQVTGKGGVPNGATAVVMNVTVTQATAASFLTVSPAGQPRPNASNLNYVAGQTVPNQVIVRLGSGGAVNMYNHVGNAHVLMDVAGYYTTSGGTKYTPLSPARILDTRTQNAPLGKQGSRTVQVTGKGGVPNGASAVVMNVTVTEATAASFLTVSPAGQPRPNASNLNYVAGQTVPNLVIVTLGSGGAVNMYNHDGSTHVLMDVAGYYTSGGTKAAEDVGLSSEDTLGGLTLDAATTQTISPSLEAAQARLDATTITRIEEDLWVPEGTEVSGDLAGGVIDQASARNPYGAGYAPKNFNKSVGRLYLIFTGGRLSVCSATVIDRSILITAGHCVVPPAGFNLTNVIFVPNQSGPVDLGVGTTDTLYFGQSVHIPPQYPGTSTKDYAFIGMFPNQGNPNRYVGDVVPPIPFLYNYNQANWIWQMGYPSEGFFHDGTGPDNSGNGRCPFPAGASTVFRCEMYMNLSQPSDSKIVTDPNNEQYLRIPSYVAGGASGGPLFGWMKVQGRPAQWYVMSVVSHGRDPRLPGFPRAGDSFVDTKGCNIAALGLRACLFYGTGIYGPLFDAAMNALYKTVPQP